jgi:hypothetical protein
MEYACKIIAEETERLEADVDGMIMLKCSPNK